MSGTSPLESRPSSSKTIIDEVTVMTRFGWGGGGAYLTHGGTSSRMARDGALSIVGAPCVAASPCSGAVTASSAAVGGGGASGLVSRMASVEAARKKTNAATSLPTPRDTHEVGQTFYRSLVPAAMRSSAIRSVITSGCAFSRFERSMISAMVS